MNISLASTDENCISAVRAFLSERYPDAGLYIVSEVSDMELSAVILADVTMPGGFSCAEHAVAEFESVAVLIGDDISIAKYAVQGYELGAVAFLKKPLTNLSLSMKLPPVIQMAKQNTNRTILLEHREGVVRIPEHEILYIELLRHKLVYHTAQGDFTTGGSMRQAISAHGSGSFAQCNSCYLVNLRHVDRVEKDTVTVGDQKLQMSREGRKNLLRAMMDYHEGGGTG